jgi:uncharacterized protein
MRVYIFMTLFTIVFILLNLYISKRFIAKLDLSERLKKYFNIFLVVNFFGILGYLFSRYDANIPNLLYFLFSIPIGVLFLLFCTAVVYDILRVVVQKVPLESKRREFFKKSLDLAALGTGVLLSGRALYEAKQLVIENVDVKIKDLAKPYSIVQLSDLHIGGLINQHYIKQMVEKVNRLKPDLVVITGDLVDIKIENAMGALRELQKLDSIYGTYFIVGNHEYFHGIEKIIDTVKSLGIKVLENENLYIGEKGKGFNLAGVYDWFGYRVDRYKPDIQKAMENKDENSPTILLAHQPRYIEEVKNGVDLILSGHTHGGQLYPFRFLVRLVQPYISGLHQHNKDLQIYVSRGTGFWGPPMRLGSKAEITYLKLS